MKYEKCEHYLVSTYTMVTDSVAHTMSIHTSDLVPVKIGEIMYKTSSDPRSDTFSVKTRRSAQVHIEPQPYTVLGTGGFANTVHVCKTSDPSQVHKYVSAHGLIKAEEVSPTNPKKVLEKLQLIDHAVSSADKTVHTKAVIESMTPMINDMKTHLKQWASNPLATQIPSVQKIDQHLSKVVDLVDKDADATKRGGQRRTRNSGYRDRSVKRKSK